MLVTPRAAMILAKEGKLGEETLDSIRLKLLRGTLAFKATLS